MSVPLDGAGPSTGGAPPSSPNPENPTKPDGTHYSDFELIAPFLYDAEQNPDGIIYVEIKEA